jgi:hypothetical protein
MSDIIGYSGSHIWKNKGSRQFNYSVVLYPPNSAKCTTYQCERCDLVFSHYYGIEPNIFDALYDFLDDTEKRECKV